MKTILDEKLSAMGLSTKAAADKMGKAYSIVFRHRRGERNVTAVYAVLYEKYLGIPREELRPDIFVKAHFQA
jgi:plasmid maintenance system antidote protein VapI